MISKPLRDLKQRISGSQLYLEGTGCSESERGLALPDFLVTIAYRRFNPKTTSSDLIYIHSAMISLKSGTILATRGVWIMRIRSVVAQRDLGVCPIW